MYILLIVFSMSGNYQGGRAISTDQIKFSTSTACEKAKEKIVHETRETRDIPTAFATCLKVD